MSKFEGTIVNWELIDTDLYRLRIAVPAEVGLHFQPGQFMSIGVGTGQRRSYSISSLPAQDQLLETFVDVSPHGPAYSYFSTAQLGQKLDILAPLGKFIYQAGSTPAVFVATGTGVVPFLSMIQYELKVLTSGRPLELYLAVPSEARDAYSGLLRPLAEEYSNFRYHLFITRPAPQFAPESGRNWDKVAGRFTALLQQIDLSAHVYVCGGNEMIQEVESTLVTRGMAPEQILYERYY